MRRESLVNGKIGDLKYLPNCPDVWGGGESRHHLVAHSGAGSGSGLD